MPRDSNVNENEISTAAADTTDHCNVDRGQLDLPPGVEVSAAPIDGDKVIWGS
jgi:hypothetical protein